MTVHATAAALRAMAPSVAAGPFAGDAADLAGSVAALEAGGARVLHLDVGDGRYSPLLVGSPAAVAGVRTLAYKDVHLMIEEPRAHLAAFAAAGADLITVQLDAGRHLVQSLREIANHASARHPERPILRGVALPLEAPVEALAPLLEELDLVLVLGVVPGYRGAMAPGLPERARAVRALLDRERPAALLSVDGGVTPADAPGLAVAGADLVVSGSALFASGRPAAGLAELQATLDAARAGSGRAAQPV